MRILLIEDDAALCTVLVPVLEKAGFGCDVCGRGPEGLALLRQNPYDAVVLDRMLPDMDGLELLRAARRAGCSVPVLLLTALGRVEDRVDGLDAGADDYLTKPFSVEELLARLRVTQRRLAMMQNGESARSSVFINGDLRIDYAAGCAWMGDKELHLTPIEYRLLCLLAQNAGKVLTHTFITQKIWGSSWENDVASLRVFMATLRKKIEKDPSAPQYIQTHVGVGYRMMHQKK